jgi:predicted ribosome quality control (RQC) complex YloA/Tae2 family protein
VRRQKIVTCAAISPYIGPMLTSLDITRVLAESASIITDSNITGVEYYRKERAVQVYCRKDKRYAVTLSFHPRQNGYYILPASKSRLDTPEKYRPFAREVWNGRIESIRQEPNDRIVEIAVATDGGRFYLVFEIIGPNGNLWLLDGNRGMMASLRHRSFNPGQPYEPTPLPRNADPTEVTADDLHAMFTAGPETNPARLMEKRIYGVDYCLARTVIADSDTLDLQGCHEIHDCLSRALRGYLAADGPIYGYYIKGKSRFYPIKISDYEPLEKFTSLSQAQRSLLSAVRQADETETFRERTLKSVRARLKKSQRLLQRLEADLAEAADYEKYLQYADLLKINRSRLERGMGQIEVENLFDGSTVIIPLDSRLNGPENIEQYSRRHRKGREALEILQRRQENTRHEIETLSQALKQFDENFEEAQRQYPEFLPAPSESGAPDTAPRRPYKEYQTSTGVTLWVGKTEADNDRLTLDCARPYDLWFHASQCPGSHVVMRFPHKKFEPSKRELAEAASLAAYYSKARGSAKVPVSYTLRKYVRKPRGAKPGLVTIDNYKTIMVEPRELEKKD